MRKPGNYYLSERHRGRRLSAVLHVLVLALAFFGLPSFLEPAPPEEPTAITVELLPITGITNVKNTQRAPEKKTEDKKPEPPKEPEHNRKPSPPVKTAEETPPPKKVEAPTPKKAEKKKPEKKKKEEKKKPEDDLAAVLRAVKTQAQQEEEKQKKEKPQASSQTQSKSEQYNPELPMSFSERDAIKNQMRQCWNVPAGARDAQNLVVVIDIEFAPDGSVISAELASESMSRYNSDSFFRAAADSAIRAVHVCSPLKGLPPDKYNTWHYTEMRFDPKEMLQ